ncbi:hypothetical protein VOLCADRAFT_98932 [Volvox carteri f. nagariensis]|uniref:Endonuclease/exonuclease/phosphatase domain-containing protein n=1 Tax=Volvox carteri f. nagariensis TaxID=3068 RepID=D8UGM9_VOLCA|nr:uncharacterized protein VOLCADRAFT_98932 [Volvox carteri f. nagariensis]EFJ41128.1 hypothetical protein VOLCADRAFT_98932 [Volvox carteri f. nagariensis]|eukprot:XP_002957800.1 hypothetical protein VOLCADRAFT_98932 [Volvox carteri f. nagariensis]
MAVIVAFCISNSGLSQAEVDASAAHDGRRCKMAADEAADNIHITRRGTCTSQPVPSAPLNDADSDNQRPSFNFRFMSWNILADELAQSHAAELYPQAHHTCLDWSRRLAAVVSHVETHRPDVLCLQEVDDWPRLRQALGAVGYDGVHLQRTGGRGDGCATMWLRGRLRLARTRSGSGGTGSGVHRQQQREREPGSGHAGLRLPRHLRRGFWVANTHVLFNTKRGDIKLGQLRVILSELAARAIQQEEDGAGEKGGMGAAEATRAPGMQDGCPTPGAAAGTAARPAEGPAAMPVLFAGDFNAAPGSGLYRFLRYGAVRLAEEDRRELSGQVEGYGYTQLQQDARAGRALMLTRWGPGPELRDQHNASGPGAATTTTTTTTTTITTTATITAASSTQAWRQMRQGRQQSAGWQQPVAPDRRSYSVRWDEEELVHAMGRAAVLQAVAALQGNGEAARSGCEGEATAAAGARGRVPPPSGGDYRSSSGNLFRSASGGYGQRRGGGWDALCRDQWHAVTEAAVVRHPLQLRSAYAAVDEQEREPIFTTLHARYVGTVDFVWYTPGDPDFGGAAARGEAEAPGAPGVGGSAGGAAASSSGNGRIDANAFSGHGTGTRGFSLKPVRVLQPPDPLSYPYGMPCTDWPSDHVSLAVDFRLT